MEHRTRLSQPTVCGYFASVPWTQVLIALAIMYAGALLAWVGLRASSAAIRVSSGIAALLACVFAVIVVPLDLPVVRTPVAIIGLVAALRVISYWIEGGRAFLREYFVFISFGMIQPRLLYRITGRRANVRPQVGREIARMLIGVAIIPAAWMLAGQLIVSDAVQRSWLLNHLIVAAALVVIMQSLGQVLWGLWRLQGFMFVRPVADQILASRTPADFWRRWTWVTHAYLWRYVYLPLGGRRRHIRAVMGVFIVSALVHEFLFAIVLGRATGHQTLFFLISGVGVLASPLLERLGQRGWAGQALMRLITLSFLASTAALFLVTVNSITPIYVKSIWLMW